MDFVRPLEAIIPGVQGRVLTVLVETTAELNLATIARLSGVSLAQASRVLPGLVSLGLVERREVPPSSLFLLVRDHVAAGPLLSLARSYDTTVLAMGEACRELLVQPVSAIVFGSFARGQADRESDIDALFVRPALVDESDEGWSASIGQWKQKVRAMTGNRIEVLEVGVGELAGLVESQRQLWRDITRDGLVVHGLGIRELALCNCG